MNTNILRRGLLALVLALGAAGSAPVAEGAQRPAAGRSAPLVAGIMQDVIGNRTRMIQVSLICVVVGIAFLWKK